MVSGWYLAGIWLVSRLPQSLMLFGICEFDPPRSKHVKQNLRVVVGCHEGATGPFSQEVEVHRVEHHQGVWVVAVEGLLNSSICVPPRRRARYVAYGPSMTQPKSRLDPA